MRIQRATAPLFALALLAAVPPASADSYGESVERDFGVRLSELADGEKIDGEGVRVRAVEHGSIADRAGLRAGDILLEIDGWSIDNVFDARRRIVREEGERVDIRVARDGKLETLDARLPERRGLHRDHHAMQHGHRHYRHYDDDIADFAEGMAEMGVSLGMVGAEIGVGVAEAVVGTLDVALSAIDWERIDDDIRISIDSVEWDKIERDLEKAFENLDDLDIHIDLDDLDHLDRDLQRKLRRLERKLDRLDR